MFRRGPLQNRRVPREVCLLEATLVPRVRRTNYFPPVLQLRREAATKGDFRAKHRFNPDVLDRVHQKLHPHRKCPGVQRQDV